MLSTVCVYVRHCLCVCKALFVCMLCTVCVYVRHFLCVCKALFVCMDFLCHVIWPSVCSAGFLMWPSAITSVCSVCHLSYLMWPRASMCSAGFLMWSSASVCSARRLLVLPHVAQCRPCNVELSFENVDIHTGRVQEFGVSRSGFVIRAWRDA